MILILAQVRLAHYWEVLLLKVWDIKKDLNLWPKSYLSMEKIGERLYKKEGSRKPEPLIF